MPDDLNLTPKEIEELANAAREAYYLSPLPVRASWPEVVRAVLRKRQEQALRRLYRDLEDPDSAASKLRDELREMTCPHWGKPLEEGA